MTARIKAPVAALFVTFAVALSAASCNLVAGLDFQLAPGVPCATAAECDDHEPCTEDACSPDLVCVHEPLADGPAPDGAQTSGDCKTITCEGGKSIEHGDDLDVPDDGKSCTIDTCQEGAVVHTPRPAGTACEDDQGNTGRCGEVGECLVACNTAADCTHTNPCVVAACDTAIGQCSFPALPDGTPTPGAQEIAGDCHVHLCVNGMDAVVVDDSDVPVTPTDCDLEVCMNGMPSNPAKPIDSPCNTFGGSDAGFCDGAGTCRACAADGECPGMANDCQHPACNNFACETAFTPAMTPTVGDPPQVPGDCQKIVCDGSGGTTMVNDGSDLPDDGNACTKDICTSGVPSHMDLADGTACGTSQVCLAGDCTGCTLNTQCTAPNTCGGGGKPNVCGCTPKTCAQLGKSCGMVSDGCFGMINCNDAIKDGTETDVDCGGNTTCGVKCGSGKKCSTAADCASGFCVDGVCCSTACNSACQACSAAKKLSGVSDGICGSAKNNVVDPRGLCMTTAQATCGTDGLCSQGACRKWPTTTVCAGASCAGSTLTAAKTCDGQGACSGGGTTMACAGGLVCSNATACYASCLVGGVPDDTKCVTGTLCDSTTDFCVQSLPSGAICANNGQCQSGFCFGGNCL
ncbi:MAG: hypothetical protein QM820_41840 [Minicystis sp.]